MIREEAPGPTRTQYVLLVVVLVSAVPMILLFPSPLHLVFEFILIYAGMALLGSLGPLRYVLGATGTLVGYLLVVFAQLDRTYPNPVWLILLLLVIGSWVVGFAMLIRYKSQWIAKYRKRLGY